MSKPPKLPHQGEYETGYKKPPKHGQFKKGQSGNPKGRPKGARNKIPKQMNRLRDMLIAEAHREITVQDKTGPLNMPVAQAALRSLALKAAQGTVSAQKLFLESLHHAESHKATEKQEIFEASVHYKDRVLVEIEQARAFRLYIETPNITFRVRAKREATKT